METIHFIQFITTYYFFWIILLRPSINYKKHIITVSQHKLQVIRFTHIFLQLILVYHNFRPIIQRKVLSQHQRIFLQLF